MAVATPERTPPAMLLRSTTAVDAPGVATSGTVIAVNAQTLTGTLHDNPRGFAPRTPTCLLAPAAATLLVFRRALLRGSRGAAGADLRRRVLGHFHVLLQCRQCLPRPRLQVGVLAARRLALEGRDVMLVVHHHLVHVGLVERRAGELGEPIAGRLVLGVELGRQRDALLLRPLFQLVVRLAMVGDHAIAELFHVVARSLFLRHGAELDLRHSADRCFLGERRVWRSGGSSLRALIDRAGGTARTRFGRL